MKKILIGCGVLVLLFIVGFGVLAWSVKDEIIAGVRTMSAHAQQMTAVGDEHPFTPPASAEEFDEERFLASLDVRTAVLADLQRLGEDFRALEEQDLGPVEWLTQFGGMALQAGGEMYGALADGLESVGMGPEEFVYHTKVMWASLKAVDAGLGGEELAPYRNVFTRVDAATSRQLGLQPNAPDSFSEFAEGVPAGIVDEAVATLSENVGRLEAALPTDGEAAEMSTSLDVITMTLPKWVADMEKAAAELGAEQPATK